MYPIFILLDRSIPEMIRMNRNLITSVLSIVGTMLIMFLLSLGSLSLVQHYQVFNFLDLFPFCPVFAIQMLGALFIILWNDFNIFL